MRNEISQEEKSNDVCTCRPNQRGQERWEHHISTAATGDRNESSGGGDTNILYTDEC